MVYQDKYTVYNAAKLIEGNCHSSFMYYATFGAATCPTEDVAAVLSYAAIIKMWWSGKGGGEERGCCVLYGSLPSAVMKTVG